MTWGAGNASRQRSLPGRTTCPLVETFVSMGRQAGLPELWGFRYRYDFWRVFTNRGASVLMRISRLA